MLKKACKVANEGWNGDSMIGSIAFSCINFLIGKVGLVKGSSS